MADKVKYSDIFDESLNDLAKLKSMLVDIDSVLRDMSRIRISGTGTGREYVENERKIKSFVSVLETREKIEKKLAQTSHVLYTEQEKISRQLEAETQILKATEREFGKLSDAYIIQKRVVDNLKQSQKGLNTSIITEVKSIDDLAKQTSQLIKKRKALDLTTESSKQEFDDLTNSIIANQNQLRNYDAQIGNFQRNVGNYPRLVNNIGASIGRLAGAFGVVGGLSLLADGIKDTAKIVVNFDDKFNELSALLGITGIESDELKQKVIDLGSATKFTATQVAEAGSELARMGFTSKEIQVSLKGILDGAVAMGSTVAETAALTSTTINAFGLNVEDTDKVVATLAASTISTATSFRYLADSMPYASTAAKQYGFSLEKTTALLGILADNSVPASTAGVALRDIFADLAVKGLTFEEALDKINKSTNKNKTAFALFGKTSMNQAIILADNIDKIDKLTESITNQEEALKKLVDKRLDTITGRFQILKSEWEKLVLSIDDGNGIFSESIKTLMEFVTDLLKEIQPLKDVFKDFFADVTELKNNLSLLGESLGFVSKETNLAKSVINALSSALEILIYPLQKIIIDFNTFISELRKINPWLNKTNENYTDLSKSIEKTAEAQAILNQENNKMQWSLQNKEVAESVKLHDNLFKLKKAILSATIGVATETKKEKKELTDAEKKAKKKAEEEALAKKKELEQNEKDQKATLDGYQKLQQIHKEGHERAMEGTVEEMALRVQASDKQRLASIKTEEQIKADREKNKQELIKYYEQASNEINKYAQKRTDNVTKEYELSNQRLDILVNQLQAETQLNEQGEANNVKRVQSQIQLEEKKNEKIRIEREKALENQQRIAKATFLIDTALQTSNLVTSITNIIKSATGTGPLGLFLAGAQIAGMFSLFALSRASALSAIQDADKFEEGGFVKGKSHKQGGKKIEVEGNEFIVRKKYAPQSANLLDMINNGLINDNTIVNNDNTKIVSLLSENNKQNSMLISQSATKKAYKVITI